MQEMHIHTFYDDNDRAELLTNCFTKSDMLSIKELWDVSRYMTAAIDFIRDAVGISANQLGISIPAFVFRDMFGEAVFCYKPVYIGHGTLVSSREGCLSLKPGEVMRAYRFSEIEAIYYTFMENKLELVKQQLRKPEAIVYQHECGHLRGEDYTKYLVNKREVRG